MIDGSFQLVDQEGDIAALTKNCRKNSGQRDNPLVVVEILGIYENFERSTLLILSAFIENDVINSHVHRVIRNRRFDLVG